jgi:hypothetical protein
MDKRTEPRLRECGRCEVVVSMCRGALSSIARERLEARSRLTFIRFACDCMRCACAAVLFDSCKLLLADKECTTEP